MSKVKSYLQRKAVENIPGPALDALGKVVLKAVDTAVARRWDDALEIAAEADGNTGDEKAANIIKKFRKELTMVGAASGAVAAAPIVGTATAVGALAADMGWFAMRATDLIMAIGAAHGHVEATEEERRAWVLAILAFEEDSADQFTRLMKQFESTKSEASSEVGTTAAGLFGGDAVTLETLRRINTDLAGQVVAKYGTRRSVLAMGKLLPFGVGAVVGGTANFGFVRMIGKQARKLFTDAALTLPAGDGPFVARPGHLSSVQSEDGAATG